MQEEGKNKKEKWGKPKLIILTRGKPEERVLAECKGNVGGGPDGSPGRCLEWEACGDCYDWGGT